MAVYVDDAKHEINRIKLYHMFADTLDELHSMADQLELKRDWCNMANAVPFYDITKAKRGQALELGAIYLTGSNWIRTYRRLKSRF